MWREFVFYTVDGKWMKKEESFVKKELSYSKTTMYLWTHLLSANQVKAETSDWLSATDILRPDRTAQFLSGVVSYGLNVAPIEKTSSAGVLIYFVQWGTLSSARDFGSSHSDVASCVLHPWRIKIWKDALNSLSMLSWKTIHCEH